MHPRRKAHSIDLLRRRPLQHLLRGGHDRHRRCRQEFEVGVLLDGLPDGQTSPASAAFIASSTSLSMSLSSLQAAAILSIVPNFVDNPTAAPSNSAGPLPDGGNAIYQFS